MIAIGLKDQYGKLLLNGLISECLSKMAGPEKPGFTTAAFLQQVHSGLH
jgi:hypothetical protein